MKKLLALVTMVLFMGMGTIFSQSWTPLGNFPNDTFMGGSGGHGIAVDPDGKVWFHFFGNTDSINNGTANVPTRVIHCFNPDGTPASFSPIKIVNYGTGIDTLYNSSRGIKVDHQGNILASHFDRIYRINYLTGQGMGMVEPNDGVTLTAAAVDGQGNMFTGPVIPPNLIQMFTPDFSFIGNAVDASIGFSRTLEVSADGNTIYWPGYTNNKVHVYSRASEFDPFAVSDSILFGFACESMNWSIDGTLLWASSGSFLTPANADPNNVTSWTTATWYGYDPVTNTVKDSIKWQFNVPANPDERPRGLGFSPDYRYAYATVFGSSAIPAIQKFENPNWTSVDQEGQVVVNGYKMSQNYPNPFNPTTRISFELPDNGFVTLKVYDMLGREVAILIDKEMSTGSHFISFDASNLSSGTYVYQLSSNGTVLTNKMTLLK